MSKLYRRLRGHLSEYVARYSVLVLAVLTPAAGLLGAFAADVGGADTAVGRAALAVASALGVAAAGIVFIRNLGVWQMLDSFGAAPGGLLVGNTARATPGPVPADLDDSVHAATDGTPGAPVEPDEDVAAA